MQWALIISETFSDGQTGWKKVLDESVVPVTQCGGGMFMLGGYQGLSNEIIEKTFTGVDLDLLIV